MNRLLATLVACLIGPLAVIPVIGIYLLMFNDGNNPPELLPVLLVSLMFSYAVSILFGIPFHVLAIIFKLESLKCYLIAGFLLPIIVLTAVPLIVGQHRGFWQPETAVLFLLMGTCGLSVAWLFKIIAEQIYSWLELDTHSRVVEGEI